MDLLTSLSFARTRILGCAGLEPAAPAGTRKGGFARRPPKDQVVYMLDLEQGDGQVVVKEAALQQRGRGSDALLDCVQHELVGQPLEAASARPGRTMKMQFTIDPP